MNGPEYKYIWYTNDELRIRIGVEEAYRIYFYDCGTAKDYYRLGYTCLNEVAVKDADPTREHDTELNKYSYWKIL